VLLATASDARGLGRLSRELARLGELLRGLRDQLIGTRTGLLGLALGFLELLLDLGLRLLALLLSLGLRLLALAPDRFVGGPLRLRDTLVDLSIGVALDLGQTGVPALADLAGLLGELPRLLGGLDRLLLGIARALRGLPCAPHPDVDGVAAEWSGVDQGSAGLAPAVAGGVAHLSRRLEGLRQQPRGVGRHLPQASPSSFRQ
jgi:hypothetical protein